MKITVKAKQAGRKRALLEDRRFEIEDLGNAPLLEDLVRAIVRREVEEFNAKPFEKNLLPFLSKDETAARAEGGKVGFGSIYNEQKADLAEAQATALQAFEDGLFGVFANDAEIRSLKDAVALDEETVITFIRLTFLSGSYW
jgi:hypothetical protein